MALASPRNSSIMSVFPQSLSTILVSLGGLAIFLTYASLHLVSSPISSVVHGYFYNVDTSKKIIAMPLNPPNQTPLLHHHHPIEHPVDEFMKSSQSVPELGLPDKQNTQEVNSNSEESTSSKIENKPSGMNKGSNDTSTSQGSSENGGTDKRSSDISLAEPPAKESDNTKQRVDVSDISLTELPAKESDNTKQRVDAIAPVTSLKNNSVGTYEQSDDTKKSSLSSKNGGGGGTDKQSDDIALVTSPTNESGNTKQRVDVITPVTSSNNSSGGTYEQLGDTKSTNLSSDSKMPSLSSTTNDANKISLEVPGCDLYHGSWYYDPVGPLYTNNSCPAITQMQNCQGNGRPDKEYENWRWKPSECDLPRFDAKKFLELMRGKTLAFIGDSVARNQMESMICFLWQVEVPKNRGNRKMHRWYFRSTDTMIVRIWSSWLVHSTSEPVDFAPESVAKVHLDAPDENFMEFIPKFDVTILSSGHWFAKQSVYMLNNEVVGGQLWWPDTSPPMKVNNIQAFGISTETILTSMVTHHNYTGLTIVRSYSPDHYEGGAWNTGGSCTGKVKPLSKLLENGFTDVMHKEQVMGFERAIKKRTNKSKLKLMDITESFAYRHDGHPGPYRSPDPNKITKRGPDGKPPPQDCLHWCMPGPVDTWNELVLEIMRREFEYSSS
ncbi:hypothetical protein ACFE04_027120 [Oxalis oulophora]